MTYKKIKQAKTLVCEGKRPPKHGAQRRKSFTRTEKTSKPYHTLPSNRGTVDL